MVLCNRVARPEWMDNSSVRESDRKGKIKAGVFFFVERAR